MITYDTFLESETLDIISIKAESDTETGKFSEKKKLDTYFCNR